MLDFVKYLPLLFQIIDLIPKITAQVKAGGDVVEKVKQIAPEVLPVLQDLGNTFFPGLTAEKAVNAGALVITVDLVRSIQTKLNAKGYTDDSGAALIVDGSYGSKTKQAVAKFQAAKGLTVDGWAGKLTQDALNAA